MVTVGVEMRAGVRSAGRMEVDNARTARGAVLIALRIFQVGPGEVNVRFRLVQLFKLID